MENAIIHTRNLIIFTYNLNISHVSSWVIKYYKRFSVTKVRLPPASLYTAPNTPHQHGRRLANPERCIALRACAVRSVVFVAFSERVSLAH